MAEIEHEVRPHEWGLAHRIATSRLMAVVPLAVIVLITIAGAVGGVALDEFYDPPMTSTAWGTIGVFAGIMIGLPLGLRIGSWIKKAARRELDAVATWAKGAGLVNAGATILSKRLRVEPFSHAGHHVVPMGWSGQLNALDVEVFYYMVDTGTRKYPERSVFTVCAAITGADSGVVEALPQKRVHAVAAAAGLQDIRVESAEFNRAWRVRADNDQGARELLTPRVIARLIDIPNERWRVAWDRDMVILVTPGVVKDVTVLQGGLEVVTDLADLTPAYLRTPADPASGAATASSAQETPRHKSVEMSWTGFAVVVVTLAGLYGSAYAFRSFGPAIGWPVVLAALVLAARASKVTAWIERLRRRHAARK